MEVHQDDDDGGGVEGKLDVEVSILLPTWLPLSAESTFWWSWA